MVYITQEMTKKAIQKMQDFHSQIESLYNEFDIDLLANSGRRNVMLSHAQEKFFAEVISEVFPSATSDGRTGQADIIIPEIQKELECKLTSGSGKYSAFEFQTDWETLVKKQKLDYLYVLTSKAFDSFAVLFFDQLTPDDFYPPSSGARGKSRMNKTKGMQKCTVLLGSVSTKNEIELKKIKFKLSETRSKKESRVKELQARLKNAQKMTPKKVNAVSGILDRETARFNKKISKLTKRANYWSREDPKFRFELEQICIGDGTESANIR
tara:strand:+ start:800 stop:1603 length:804 start_codon:yes stop_codon:yes gene_type:complete